MLSHFGYSGINQRVATFAFKTSTLGGVPDASSSTILACRRSKRVLFDFFECSCRLVGTVISLVEDK